VIMMSEDFKVGQYSPTWTVEDLRKITDAVT
jgi:hypothetical protein